MKNTKQMMRDVFSDTWQASDNLCRDVNVKAVKPNDRQVGIFYFLWHEQTKEAIYDHNRAYLEGGKAKMWETMVQGPLGFAHYWAEPYFGYYCSNDTWVLRKHASELVAAGVDFVYLDATNGLLYEPNLEALFSTWAQMRKEGLKTPAICSLMRVSNQDELNRLWELYYSKGKYQELWYYWDGKPLIMLADNDFGHEVTFTEQQKEFFTIRYSWAQTEGEDWYDSRNGVNCWPWANVQPQTVGCTLDADGNRVPEQMCVMCGYWANATFINGGRSWTRKNGMPTSDKPWDFGYALMEKTTGLGLGFQEAFDYAREKNPPMLMVTGWNEWWAGRWDNGPRDFPQTVGDEYHVTYNPGDREYNYFVDNLNPEYSRDIEAMKGGFTDNYYYQLTGNVRAYKGARSVEPAFGQGRIDIYGSTEQWNRVGPEYRDPAFDTAHRNHPSAVGQLTYINDSGRNDFITAKVSGDETYWYFYAECRETIVMDTGTDWMNLLIKADHDQTTGWYGFDYILNRSRDGAYVSVERFTSRDGANRWDTETIGRASYTVSDNVIQIQVEKNLLSLGATFDFKWADHSVKDGDILQFMDRGDTAPDDRFCYRFTTESQDTPDMPADWDAGTVVVKANSYNALAGKREIHLVPDNTRAVALIEGHTVRLPVAFLEAVFPKIKWSTDFLSEENGNVAYADVTALSRIAGKTVTVTSEGLAVIADKPVADENLLRTLYRILH